MKKKIIIKKKEKEMSHGLMDNDANLCNFRGISGTVNTSQAHFKIISLHVYNSSYRPDTTNRERQQQMYNQIPITFFVFWLTTSWEGEI